MQILALEYLRYADGLKESARAEREEEFRRDLLLHVVKASLVASGQYKEDVLFANYFPEPENDEIDFSDNSGIEFEAPTEDEMEMLARLLADDTVTVSNSSLEDEGEAVPQAEPPSLPPPRDFDPTQVDQDTEWV